MVFQNNSVKLTEEIKKAGGLSELTGYPRSIGETFVPAIEMNPKLLREITLSKSAVGGTSTIYTTPTRKDFYIVAAVLGVNKLAADTGTDAVLFSTKNGQVTTILNIPGITLTADKQVISISLPIPMKLDRGVNIVSDATNITRVSAIIYGFEVDEVGA